MKKSIVFLCIFCIYILELKATEDGIFKKIVLVTKGGKVTAVDAESIVGFKRTEVHKSKNWYTTVLQLDENANLISTRYRDTPTKIYKSALNKGVEYIKLHDGQYFNPAYFDKSELFLTETSVFFKKSSDLYNKHINEQNTNKLNRSGKIILADSKTFDVSKRMVSIVRDEYSKIKYKHQWLRKLNKGGKAVEGISIITGLIYLSMPDDVDLVRDILIKEYDEVLLLEGYSSRPRRMIIAEAEVLEYWGELKIFRESRKKSEHLHVFPETHMNDLSPLKKTLLKAIYQNESTARSPSHLTEKRGKKVVAIIDILFGVFCLIGLIFSQIRKAKPSKSINKQ